MKLGPDMYQLNTFNIIKMRVSVERWVGGGGSTTKKTAKNVMKLRGTLL